MLLGSGVPGQVDRVRRTPYDTLGDLANSLEMIDTRNWDSIWVEDRTGDKWDVKLDILNGRLEDTEFFRRTR